MALGWADLRVVALAEMSADVMALPAVVYLVENSDSASVYCLASILAAM